MSVLIKGMEMPKRGMVVNIHADGRVTRHFDEFGKTIGKAIPVPPHGGLIDADALLMRINHEVMEAYMDGACYGAHPSQEYLYLLGEIIDDAPTIIPAEEGE